jgi:hypothetical protein
MSSVHLQQHNKHHRAEWFLSISTCFAIPLRKPSRNEPNQNHGDMDNTILWFSSTVSAVPHYNHTLADEMNWYGIKYREPPVSGNRLTSVTLYLHVNAYVGVVTAAERANVHGGLRTLLLVTTKRTF